MAADSSFATITESLPPTAAQMAAFAPRDVTPSSAPVAFKSVAKPKLLEDTPIIPSVSPPVVRKIAPVASAPAQLTVAEQLSAARNEIDTLRAQLVEGSSGLRSRNAESGSSARNSMGNADMFVAMEKVRQDAGVPLNVVVGLVVGTFVFTWYVAVERVSASLMRRTG